MASNVLLVACDDAVQPHPAERVSDEPVIAVSAAPVEHKPTQKAPEPERSPRCHRGYRPSGKPELDIARLGALCGPSHGLAPQPTHRARRWGANHYQLKLAPGECAWLAVATEPGAEAVEFRWHAGDQELAACEISTVGWCPSAEPLCSADGSTIRLESERPLSQAAAWQLWLRRERKSPK